MKKLLTAIILGCTLALLTPACSTPKLEQGGAYAPITADGKVEVAPDLAFFTVEASFKLAHQTIKTVFDLEFENRALLWKFSPEIKHALDKVRPDVNEAIRKYGDARDAYKKNPTPAGLSGMDTALAKVKQLAITAEAVLPKDIKL